MKMPSETKPMTLNVLNWDKSSSFEHRFHFLTTPNQEKPIQRKPVSDQARYSFWIKNAVSGIKNVFLITHLWFQRRVLISPQSKWLFWRTIFTWMHRFSCICFLEYLAPQSFQKKHICPSAPVQTLMRMFKTTVLKHAIFCCKSNTLIFFQIFKK